MSQVGVQAIRIGVMLILAKYFLKPSDFGLVNMFIIISGFSKVLIDFGYGMALIQKKDTTQVDYSSVFYFNILLSIVITLILFFSSSYIAGFYNKPQLIPIIKVLSPIYFFNSLSIVNRLKLQKELNFKSLSIVELGAIGFAGLLSITFAMYKFEVWSLVVFHLTNSISAFVIFWVIVRNWKPSLVFSFDSIKSISSFSLSLIGNKSLNYWSRNFDKLLIGRSMGEHVLGIYSQAFSFVLIPVSNVANVFVRVLFPSFSTIQDEKEEVFRIFKRASRIILMVLGGGFILLSAVPDLVVKIILDEEWFEMIPILQGFSIVALFASLRTIQSSVYLSQDRNELLFKINIVGRLFTIGLFLLIMQLEYGVIYFVYGMLFSLILLYFITSYFLCEILESSFVYYLISHMKILLSELFALLIICLFRIYVKIDVSAFIELGICSILYLSVLCTLLYMVKEEVYFYLINVVKTKLYKPLMRKINS